MTLLQGNSRKAPFLTRYRQHLRHAWLLHAWLIFSLLLLPAGRLARADGGDGFTLASSESSVAVSAWAPQGTSGMQTGEARQVITSAQMNTWEVWTNSETGATEIRNALTVPLAGTEMTFSASGDGSVNPDSATTDSAGNAVTNFIMGNGASMMTATVTQYGATGTVTFDTPVIPETWTWDHDESLISASLSTTDSTDNVPNGAARQIQAHVDLTTWSVYVSNYLNTKTGNLSTSPAIGAQVSWSIASGDGSASGSTSTDSTGNAGASLTMGSAASVVRADVSYATSTSTYATLGFNPAMVEETWALDHVESSISNLILSANGSTDGLTAGTVRTLTAAVTSASYEVWVSNRGNTEYRNSTTGPGTGVSVSFSLDYGDGSLSGYSATTDYNGNASVDFTMGGAASQVAATAGGYSASIGFYPMVETWTYDHTASVLSFSNFTADGSTDDLRPGNTRTLTAEVMSTTCEVWASNYGNAESRNVSSGPASNVTVGFSVTSGDGAISTGSATTDGSGHASTGFTMGTQASTVQANGYDGTNNLGVISTSITRNLGQPTWTYDHTETTISTSLTADGTTDSLPAGATRVVTAKVTFTSLEVWIDDAGNNENRNYSSGGANNASMYFYVTTGDGTLSNVQSSTDSNGNATTTFTMGSQASTVQADVSYAGAYSYGTITFTADPWVYYSSDTALDVSLVDNSDASTATATVTFNTWDVYTNGSTYENRNYSSGPAGGAYVTFTGGGDAIVDTASTTTGGDGTATTGYSSSSGGDGGQGSISVHAEFNNASADDIIYVSTAGSPPIDWDVSSEKVVDPQTSTTVTVQLSGTVTFGKDPSYNQATLLGNTIYGPAGGSADIYGGTYTVGGETFPIIAATASFTVNVTVTLIDPDKKAEKLASTNANEDVWKITIHPRLKFEARISNLKIYNESGIEITENAQGYQFDINILENREFHFAATSLVDSIGVWAPETSTTKTAPKSSPH